MKNAYETVGFFMDIYIYEEKKISNNPDCKLVVPDLDLTKEYISIINFLKSEAEAAYVGNLEKDKRTSG